MADPYVYPDTTVLRNLLELTDADALAEREAQASTLRLAQLAAVRLEGSYDLAHLQAVHRFIFQDIYAWAGQLRRVPLAKPGSMFALPEHVESYATTVLCDLAKEQHLGGLSRDAFVERLTHYYAEINAVHPFREGKGRAQRAFLRQLALDAGHTVSWEGLNANQLVHASRQSFRGDNRTLRDLIDLAVDRADREG